jgi:uncharacterized protein YehS (DUF1456 family)
MAYNILIEKLGDDLTDYIVDFLKPSKFDVILNYNSVMSELLFRFSFKKYDYYMVLDEGEFPIIFRIYHHNSYNLFVEEI